MNLPLRTLPSLSAVALSLALAAPFAFAQGTAAQGTPAQGAPAAGMHRGHPHGLSDQTLQSIGATADQRAKILAIQQQARADLRAQHQAARDLRQQMAQALAAPTVDAAAAESARQKMLAQKDAASQRMLQAKLMIAAVLTPEQRQQLLALEQQRQSRWHEPHRQSGDANGAGNG